MLCDARSKLGIAWSDPANDTHARLVAAADPRPDTLAFTELAPSVACLWADGGVRQAYDRRAEYQLVSVVLLVLGRVLVCDRACVSEWFEIG